MKTPPSIATILPILLALGIAASLIAEDENDATPKLELADGWTLKAMTSDGAKTPGLTGKNREATLFVDGRTISGSSGCNSFSGKARFRGGSVRIGDISFTEMACDDAAVMKQETAYFPLLTRMTHFNFKGHDLILSDGTAGNRMHFIPTKAPKAKPLVGTKWTLEGFEESGGQAVSMTALVKGSKIDLLFGKDGRLSGSGGVNRYFSGYEADIAKGTLKIGGIGSTRKGGPPELMKQEAKYFKQLQSMTRIEIVGGRLILKDKKQVHALLFTAD